jgi:hypothetical protein
MIGVDDKVVFPRYDATFNVSVHFRGVKVGPDDLTASLRTDINIRVDLYTVAIFLIHYRNPLQSPPKVGLTSRRGIAVLRRGISLRLDFDIM